MIWMTAVWKFGCRLSAFMSRPLSLETVVQNESQRQSGTQNAAVADGCLPSVDGPENSNVSLKNRPQRDIATIVISKQGA
jgi:hypothetical protein